MKNLIKAWGYIFLVLIGLLFITTIIENVVLSVFEIEVNLNILWCLIFIGFCLWASLLMLISPILNIYAGIKYKTLCLDLGFWVGTLMNLGLYFFIFAVVNDNSLGEGELIGLLMYFMLPGGGIFSIIIIALFYFLIEDQKRIEKRIEKRLQEINDEINLQNPQK